MFTYKKIISLSLPLTLLTIFLINGFIKNNQEKRENEISKELMSHTQEIRAETILALNDAYKSDADDCSPESIDKLREIRQRFKVINDIGVINDSSIICSANWGVINKNVQIVSYYTSENGYSLYIEKSNNKSLIDNQRMISKYGYIIMNSELEYDRLSKLKTKSTLNITSSDGSHVFFSSAGRNNKIKDGVDLFTVRTKSCARDIDLCVISYDGNGGLRSFSWFLLILLTIIIFLFWCFSLSFIYNLFSKRNNLEKRFLRACHKHLFYIEYQPIIAVNSGNITAIEALVRWRDELYGQVSPEIFVTLAEKIGLYKKLSEFVVRRSLQEYSTHLKGEFIPRISLNVEDGDIQNEKYLELLYAQCQEVDIPVQNVKLEITERCRLGQDYISEFCNKAKKYGFFISIDDFGTGAANIVWLTELCFDEVKIDRALVANIIDNDKRDFFISVVNKIKMKGKSIVFEGVETIEQFESVRMLCPGFLVQGWYTGKPMSMENIKKQLCKKSLEKVSASR